MKTGRSSSLAVTCALWLLVLSAHASGTVTALTEANLRAALAGGGTVTFAVDGTITLASTLVITNDTLLDGAGRAVTLDGDNAVRVLQVQPGVKLTIEDLILTKGRATGSAGGKGADGSPAFGGAVLVDQGTLTALNCRFWSNSASGGAGGNGNPNGSGGAASGGAIYLSGGMLNATNSEFTRNLVLGGVGGTNAELAGVGSGGQASGGAICAKDGGLNLDKCQFASNEVIGGRAPDSPIRGDMGVSGEALGGALSNSGGTAAVARCSFRLNSGSTTQPSASSGASGSAVRGGAVYHTAGILCVEESQFLSNSATGGSAARNSGSSGMAEGGALFNSGKLDLVRCEVRSNLAAGGDNGIAVSDGRGGALFSGGEARIRGTIFDANRTSGGHPFQGIFSFAPGGSGRGGAIFNADQLTITDTTFSRNRAQGIEANTAFSPNPGSPAYGGAVFNSGTFAAMSTTFVANCADGGPYNNGAGIRGGDAFGGGIFCETNGSLTLINCTLAENGAIGGSGNPVGGSFGGGIASTNGLVTLANTIIANSTSGSNAFGTLTDLGQNLSSDASCNFTNIGSLNNTDPKLGPLANYGGPTPTLPLLSGSPAIDGGALSGAPATDQRGRSRPFGAAVDIGAFESSPPYLIRGNVTGYALKDEVSVGGAGTTTSSNGWFSLEGVNPGSYSVTPAHTNYLFVPASRAVNGGPDQLGVNFRAYRWNTLSLDDATNGVLHVVFAGTNGISYRTLWSSNLANWTPVSTNTVNASSYFELLLPATSPAGFHKVVTP